MKFSQDQRLLALYQQLHDELSQLIEDPETGVRLRDAVGQHKYQTLVDLLEAAANIA